MAKRNVWHMVAIFDIALLRTAGLLSRQASKKVFIKASAVTSKQVVGSFQINEQWMTSASPALSATRRSDSPTYMVLEQSVNTQTL